MRKLIVAAICALGLVDVANAEAIETGNSAASATCSSFDLRLRGIEESVEICNCHTVVVLRSGGQIAYYPRHHLETLLEIPGAKLYVERQGVVIVDLRHIKMTPPQSSVRVQVLLITKDKVLIKVQGMTYRLEGKSLTAWNANQPRRFGTVRLRKSQIPSEYYFRILRQSLPSGTPI